MAKKKITTKKKTTTKKKRTKTSQKGAGASNYPRHGLEKALRIPKAILDQNAGKVCSVSEAAKFAGVGLHGPTQVEISSAIKYGLLERPKPKNVIPSDLARKILKPQREEDELQGLREAIQQAPVVSSVYSHYRGENLPDEKFFANALTDTFGIPADTVAEFITIFLESLRTAKLIEETGGKIRVLDVSHTADDTGDNRGTLQRLSESAAIAQGDTCFIMMPFAPPHGGYYSQIYEKAIEKAGLTPVRADAELFGTGKIIDQIWRGINEARVLVAELTTRNPNVFYELGLAHALQKPVVLVSATEDDVPFDLRHIRVIYYDTTDPFWGQKLLDKVAENILSALRHPEEAVFQKALSAAE